MTARAALPALLLVLLVGGAGCTAQKSDLPVPVVLACNELDEILKAMPFEHVGRTTGTVAQPVTAQESRGCRIVADGSRARLSDLVRTSQHSPDGRLRELLPARGWGEDTRFATDRADGNTFAFERGGVMCYFAARWGGADDTGADSGADADALGPDRYELSVGCALPAP